jgi:hypothetical protein
MVQVLARFEEDGTSFVLRKVGDRIDLFAGQVHLLSSAALATEGSFGELAERVADRPKPRVLVGGLGFGETALAALKVLPKSAEVVIAERYRSVHQALEQVFPERAEALAKETRATLSFADVAETMVESAWDAILLDVDNGPEWATRRSNQLLYSARFLKKVQLTPKGFLAVWSGYAKDTFVGELRRAGFQAEVMPLKENGAVRARAYIGNRA